MMPLSAHCAAVSPSGQQPCGWVAQGQLAGAGPGAGVRWSGQQPCAEWAQPHPPSPAPVAGVTPSGQHPCSETEQSQPCTHTAEVIETTICIIRDLVEGPGGGGEVVRAAPVLRGGAAAVSGAGAVLGPRAVRAAPVLGVAAAADLGRLAGAGTGGGLVKVKGIILLQVCGTLLLLLLQNTFLANIGYDQTVLHDHHLTPITFNTTAAISLCPVKDKYNCKDNSLCLPHYLNIYMKELPSLNAKFLF